MPKPEGKTVAEQNKNHPIADLTSGKSVLQREIKQGYAQEISLYEDFFDKVTQHAKTHRQISINNLKESEKRLHQLKTNAEKIADSIFYHDEEIVVQRSRIISETEDLVRVQNEDILHHDRLSFDDTIQAIDYLAKALMQVKYDFIGFYSRSHLNSILSTEDFFDYYMQKSHAFQVILDRHQNEVYELFVKLDEQIKSMDDAIGNIIQSKNRKVTDIETFYDKEAHHFADNQLSFSAESDPTSIEIQALASDKINQYKAFCDHSIHQNMKIQKVLEDDYLTLYQRVLGRLLQSRSYQIINRFDLFDDPLRFKIEYKQKLLDAEAKGSKELRSLLRIYQKICRWQKDVRSAETRATMMLKTQAKRKETLLKLSEETSVIQMNRLELYLNEYLEVMKFDPFLAQAIGDYSSKIIKDELARLSLLKLNKELKTNIDYDIQATKIKSQINELEIIMMNSIKKQLCLQEGELLSELNKIPLFLLEKRHQLISSSLAILRERHLIERLDKATNEHLAYLLVSGNTSRRWISIVSDELISNTRDKETHNIYVVEAKSEIELALKQYDISAIHIQTMYENEKSYLVMQKSRVDEETKINNDFILTTYLNQMRFAQEQIALAESEYRVRLESLMVTIDQERKFYNDQINLVHVKYDQNVRLIEDAYQAKLYSESHKIAETVDKKAQKALAISLEKDRRIRDQQVNVLVKSLAGDEVIIKSQNQLRSIDDQLQEAIHDADVLREATIREFTELYEHAKSRYEILKPYMDNAINILDPTFYDGLAAINERYHAKIHEAESELDRKIEKLLPQYREVFFTQDVEDHSLDYRARIEEIMMERETNEAVYQQKLQAVENHYRQELTMIDAEEESSKSAYKVEIDTIHNKEVATSAQFAQMAKTIDAEGDAKIKAHREATLSTINQLTDEYFISLKASKKTIADLSDDFQKLLDGYQDYLGFSEGEKKYRYVLKSIKKANRKKLHNSLKQLKIKYRHYHIFNQKN
jgi:hypothetical protein